MFKLVEMTALPGQPEIAELPVRDKIHCRVVPCGWGRFDLRAQVI